MTGDLVKKIQKALGIRSVDDNAQVYTAANWQEIGQLMEQRNWPQTRNSIYREIENIRPSFSGAAVLMAGGQRPSSGAFAVLASAHICHLHSLAARCWVREGRWEEAQKEALRGAAAHSEDDEPKQVLLDLYISKGQFDEARLQLEELVRRDIDGCARLLELGLFVSLHDRQAAASCFQRAIALDSIGLVTELANYNQDRLDKGLLPVTVDRLQTLNNQGFRALRAGETASALQCFLMLLASSADSPGPWLMVGKIYQENLASRPAAHQNPDGPPVFALLDDSETAQKYLQRAAQAYRMTLRHGAQLQQVSGGQVLSEVRRALGNCYLGLGEPAMALPVLKAAAELRPDDPAVLGDLGKTFLAMDELDQAEAVLRKALQGSPEDPIARHDLALVLYRIGRVEEARRYEKAARTFSSH